jgi:hypothetical protein
MCLIFLGYGFWEFLVSFVNISSSAEVWKDSGMFSSRGMSFLRTLIHVGSCANQVWILLTGPDRECKQESYIFAYYLMPYCFSLQLVGLRAHSKREIQKADWFVP